MSQIAWFLTIAGVLAVMWFTLRVTLFNGGYPQHGREYAILEILAAVGYAGILALLWHFAAWLAQ